MKKIEISSFSEMQLPLSCFLLVKHFKKRGLNKKQKSSVCSLSGATRLGGTFLAGQDGEDQQSNREITSNEASDKFYSSWWAVKIV